MLEAPRDLKPRDLKDGGFKLIDPDGLLAEAEYDLGIVMREDPVELRHGDPAEWARRLARRCGLDATAIWEWGVVERVSTGLLATRIGLQPVGREMLATADLLARLAAFGDHLYPLQRGAAAAHSHAPRYIGLRYSVGRYRVRRHNRERAMRTQGRPT